MKRKSIANGEILKIFNGIRNEPRMPTITISFKIF